MTLYKFFWGLGDILDYTFTPLHEDVMGNAVNYLFIIGIASGLLFWLFTQKKLSDKAANDPNQLK